MRSVIDLEKELTETRALVVSLRAKLDEMLRERGETEADICAKLRRRADKAQALAVTMCGETASAIARAEAAEAERDVALAEVVTLRALRRKED